MASPQSTRPDADSVLTTEQFMDLLSSKSPTEIASLQSLKIKAYPFPLYPSKNASAYTTYTLSDLLPLFPGLALQTLSVHDAYHGPDVGEDGWGHNATNSFVEQMVKTGMGWKELVFESSTDRWLEPVSFVVTGGESGRGEEVHGRDAQPRTWDGLIRARNGEGRGAGVEMWYRGAGEGGEWVEVVGDYKPSVGEGEDDSNDGDEGRLRPAIKIRIRRGDGVDYKQQGPESLDKSSWGLQNGLYEIFENSSWQQIKEELFMTGAEEDPTAHL